MKILMTITILVSVVALANPARAAEHPTLVSVESAQCSFCHEELLEGKVNVHPPVADDCTTCHEFSKGEDGTTVELMESEPSLCVICHDEMSSAVELELETPHFPVGDSCLNCHDPHASENAQLLLAPPGKLCGECHDIEDLDKVHGGQLTGATNCTSCHAPHGSDNQRMLVASKHHAPFADGSCTGCHREPFGDRIRLRARGQRLCIACHGDFPEHEAGSKHGALEDQRGRAACLSCHSPHMSEHSRLLLESGIQLCGECHAAVVEAAEAETGHFPAADDCSSCHLPHTSEEVRLLTVPKADLCAECHDLEDEDLSATHLGASLDRLQCLDCHSPHGAGNPSALAEHLHPPIEDGCDICHEGAFNELFEDGEASLCLMCHDDIGEFAAEATVSHDAMEMDSCVLCHNPHASPQEKLVNAPGAGPCAECHEQAAGPDEVAHGVIDLIGCRACHEPHGGENEKLLRKSGEDLCFECHLPGRARSRPEGGVTAFDRFAFDERLSARMQSLRLSDDLQTGHPVTNHRVLGVPTKEGLKRSGSSFEGELTCTVCHDPHKGRSSHLFKWDASSSTEVCLNCHDR